MLRHTVKAAEPILRKVFHDYYAACTDAESILFHLLTALPAASIAEKLRLPAFPCYLQHVHPSRYLASPAFPPWRTGLSFLEPFYNRATYLLEDSVFWYLIKPVINRWRQDCLSLGPYLKNPFTKRTWSQGPFFYGFSRHVIPEPPDWGSSIHVTGYWFLKGSAAWTPPSDLIDFLESGPPPIYVGFGSMVNRNPEELTSIILRALARTAQRGILLTGWGGISNRDLPTEVFKIESVPHDWLFPRVSAVIHHGGAGTTAAGLRAGRPTLVVPFFGDQTFWGWRIYQLGVGPKPIPRRKLTVSALAAAIEQLVGNSRYAIRAEAVGAEIRGENGVENTVRLLRKYLRIHAGRER